MRTNKIIQVAKFHTSLPIENANQLCVVLEIIEVENGKEYPGTLFVS